MGLFKKKKAVVRKTFATEYEKQLAEEQEKIASFKRMVPRLNKFILKYQKTFNSEPKVFRDYVQIYFKQEYSGYDSDYPDGFYAYADKLGLNIQPVCNNGAQWHIDAETYPTKGFQVKAKAK